MQLKITTTNQYKKDLRKVHKQGKNLKLLTKVIEILASGELLPLSYKDHPLTGNYSGTRECHIQPDWLLIYRIEKNNLILTRTGSHSHLF